MHFTTGREFSIASTMDNLTNRATVCIILPQRVLIRQLRAPNLHGLILEFDITHIRSILFKGYWWFEIIDLLKLRR